MFGVSTGVAGVDANASRTPADGDLRQRTLTHILTWQNVSFYDRI